MTLRERFCAACEFRPDAHQPIWFSAPKLFIDNDTVPWGEPGRERLEAATYVSLTEYDGEILGLRIYDRYLRTSEAVTNYKAEARQ